MGEGDPIVPTTLLSPSPFFKKEVKMWNIHGWELCKRSTGCKGCSKTMLKGERRLKATQPGYRFKIINYYCSDCGEDIQRGEVLLEKSSKVVFKIPLGVKRRRMLRPE